MRVRLSRLAATIERLVPPIPAPSRRLEQYTTPGELAVRSALILYMRLGDRVDTARIADLGAGTCRLAIASALIGLAPIIAVEADPRLPPICVEAAERTRVDWAVEPVVGRVSEDSGPLSRVDAVITNPPFGVWRRGADAEIIRYAMGLGASPIVAILKLGSYKFFTREASLHGYRVDRALEYEFPLPASMEHHRSRIKRIRVEVLVFERAE